MHHVAIGKGSITVSALLRMCVSICLINVISVLILSRVDLNLVCGIYKTFRKYKVVIQI